MVVSKVNKKAPEGGHINMSVARLTVMPARESIESLVSLKLSQSSSFALDMKLAVVGLASK